MKEKQSLEITKKGGDERLGKKANDTAQFIVQQTD
jgi:hypothetical protein